VLALDENGHAAAWVKSYGGPPGSGFVRIEADGRDPARLALVAAVAERFPDESNAGWPGIDGRWGGSP
jgi:hypothetical protein